MNRIPPRLTTLLLLAVAACADAPQTEMPQQTPADDSPASVQILGPLDGSEIDGPDVTVRLGASGIHIRPAGDTTSNSGHHHLYLDTDLGPPGLAVPSVAGAVVHLGDGSSEYTFVDVAPGPHRLIAIIADWIHVPVEPRLVDTVTFTVR